MFIAWNDASVRLTGRWTYDEHRPAVGEVRLGSVTLTTAPGSSFELAFRGRMAQLVFDLGCCAQPYPHVWISVDGGARIEAPLDRYLRVQAPDDGDHVVRVVYKGAPEILPRWHEPLMGAVVFAGAVADAPAQLPEDTRKLVEFVGDSITEGVLIDTDFARAPSNVLEQFDRPYQDDNLATYAALTAEKLNVRAMFQAYGAVGVTRGGCGGVPMSQEIYPWVFDGAPYLGPAPDLVVINLGTNDSFRTGEEFKAGYMELLEVIRAKHPGAAIACLSPFCGVFAQEIADCAEALQRKDAEARIHFISTAGWLPREPIHPMRDGHRIAAEHLAPLLADLLN